MLYLTLPLLHGLPLHLLKYVELLHMMATGAAPARAPDALAVRRGIAAAGDVDAAAVYYWRVVTDDFEEWQLLL